MSGHNTSEPAFSRPLHVGAPNVPSRARFLELVDQVLDANWLTNDGPLVRELETSIAAHLGLRHCVLVCNGTVALEIAARCLGLQGEVIIPSLTFVATAGALEWLGIKPVFCDVDPRTYCIDPAEIERLVTPKTTAILGVHLFGRPCDADALTRIAERHGLTLLFDAAHAFGCSAGGRMIGGLGACEVFSFHATKFFNTIEGGAVTTNDPDLAHRVRLARNFGFENGSVRALGINGKMNEVCAAMGLSNLEALQTVVECNRRNYGIYREGFSDLPGIRLMEYDDSEKNNYQYVVAEVLPEFGQTRDQLVESLHRDNVLARSYFAPGCHAVEPFCSDPACNPELPHTLGLCERLVTFPTGTRVSAEDVLKITALVRAAGPEHSRSDGDGDHEASRPKARAR